MLKDYEEFVALSHRTTARRVSKCFVSMVAASQNTRFNEALDRFLSLTVTDYVINSLATDSALDSYQESV